MSGEAEKAKDAVPTSRPLACVKSSPVGCRGSARADRHAHEAPLPRPAGRMQIGSSSQFHFLACNAVAPTSVRLVALTKLKLKRNAHQRFPAVPIVSPLELSNHVRTIIFCK